MTGIPRRLKRLLAAAALVLIATLTATASASATPSPPVCGPSVLAGSYPQADCVLASYRSDSYTTQLMQSGALSVSHTFHGKGQYIYELVTVKVGFSDVLAVCPGGGVPLGDIPCQTGSASIGLQGRYIPKQKDLSTNPLTLPFSTPVCDQQVPSGSCTLTMRFNEAVLHGSFVYVINVSVGELTQNPANDLGISGFQFPVSVTVPKLATKKKHG